MFPPDVPPSEEDGNAFRGCLFGFALLGILVTAIYKFGHLLF